MKAYLISALALASTAAFSADYLQGTIKSLENDYQMVCTASSDTSYYCHDKSTKLIGMMVDLKENYRGGNTLDFKAINNSEDAIAQLNSAKDSKFWGKKIVENLLMQIQDESRSECAELHPNYINSKKNYVFAPWGHELMRSECINSKGELLNVKADTGAGGGFLKRIKIF